MGSGPDAAGFTASRCKRCFLPAAEKNEEEDEEEEKNETGDEVRTAPQNRSFL